MPRDRQKQRKSMLAYYHRTKNNPEKIAKRKAYYKANRERLLAKQKSYYWANREERLAYYHSKKAK